MNPRFRVRRVTTAPRRTSAATGRPRPPARPPRHPPRPVTLKEAPASEPVLAPSFPPSEPPNPAGVVPEPTNPLQGPRSDKARSPVLSRPFSHYTESLFFALCGKLWAPDLPID